MFMPYPATFPFTDGIPVILNCWRTKSVTPEAVNAAWHLAGYGLGTWYPTVPNMAALKAAAAMECTQEQGEAALLALAEGDDGAKCKALGFDWKAIAMKIVLWILAGGLGSV